MMHATLLVSLAALAAAFPRERRSPTTLVPRADLTPATNLPAGFQYLGCYTDSGDRKLDGARFDSTSGMTNEACVNYCNSRGFPYAGAEYAQECFCGYSLKSGATKVADSECNMACTGNAAQPCGAGYRLTVFGNGAGPQAKAAANGYTHKGCYSEGPQRVLAHGVHTSQTSPVMTVELCTSACKQAGYSVAGVEYGGECFCDNALAASAQLQSGDAAASGCSMTCNGDRTEYCGGPNRLNVYVAPGATTTTTTTAATTSTTSTTTATTTSTTSTTTTATTAAPTTTSTTTPTPTTAAAKQVLSNPGFDNNGIGWTAAGSAAGQQDLYLIFGSDSTNSHTAPGYAYVSGQTSGISGSRGMCLSTTPTIDKAGSYRLEFYLGSLDQYGGGAGARPQYNLGFTVDLAGTSFSGTPCVGGVTCSELTANGVNRRYGKHAYTVTVPTGAQTLKVCLNYVGQRRGTEDYFFLDDVTLTGPN